MQNLDAADKKYSQQKHPRDREASDYVVGNIKRTHQERSSTAAAGSNIAEVSEMQSGKSLFVFVDLGYDI